MTGSIVELEVVYLGETEKAIKIEYEGEEYWIPDSQIHPDSEVHVGSDCRIWDTCTLVCSRWIAEEKGLVDE